VTCIRSLPVLKITPFLIEQSFAESDRSCKQLEEEEEKVKTESLLLQ